MQLDYLESMADYGLKALAQITLALMPDKGVVADVTTSEEAENNIADVDNTRDPPVILATHKEREVSGLPCSREEGTKLRGRRRCNHPWMMERLTGICGCNELTLVGKLWQSNEDAGFQGSSTFGMSGNAVCSPKLVRSMEGLASCARMVRFDIMLVRFI